MKKYCFLGLIATVFCFVRVAEAQSPVQIGFGQAGLSSIQFNGFQYLGYTSAGLNAVNFLTPQGQTIPGDLTNTRRVDAAQSRVIQTYPWGTTTTVYSVSANRLRISITTTNNSPNPITGLFLDALGLQLPSKPQEYDGVIPILSTNQGSPTALRLTYGSGTVVLTNDDVTGPLTVGFPWALNRPTSTLFPVKVNTGKEGMYPDNIPFIDRPIAPGASDTFSLSLRFGDAGATTSSLARDVFQAFNTAYPSLLNWPDRRPIGSLIAATAATGWATNPRGWLLDPSINITTPQGIAAFQARLLTWADNAVAILKGMNAQGMITWDIEGEQFPHATTYIGDPRLFSTLAPEMTTVADAYFKKFRDAGLRVGVCIRPQQLIVAPDGRSASQQEAADPVQLMIDKMTWAKQRWGATLFYVDSNGDPNLPYDPKFFRRVAQALPDVLVFPEHKNTGYYGVSAPYAELRQGYVSTPGSVRDVYPGAFTLINTADGPIDARYTDLQAAVGAGDIMMFRGWFDDGNNAKIKALYAGKSFPAPAASFASPAANSIVSGVVNVVAQASAAGGLSGVRLLVDNLQFGLEITAGSYSWAWDTSSLTNGPHTLSVIVRDATGQTGTASETVQVSNAAPAPVLSIASPAAGSTVSGLVTLQANASSSIGIATVAFAVDGTPAISPWNSASVSNGVHTLTATAKDTAGTATSASITFSVSNAAPAPVVSIASPAAGSTVSGLVTLQANASSSIGIASVTFAVDGTPAVSPWNSASVSNGSHTLTATAKDSAGTATSASITFSVSNAAPAPVVSIASPAAGSTVSGLVTLQANASSSIGIATVAFAVDGTPAVSPWNSASVSNGVHTLTATAKDTAGTATSASITFSVSNAAPAPVISIASPAAGSTVSGLVTLQANASSSIGIATVTFAVDGTPAVSPWNSASVSNGSHTLTATAKDTAGTATSASITFSVSNAAPAPVISIASPVAGSTVSGQVFVKADASGRFAIFSMQLAVDGNPIAAPWWDSRTVANGPHTMAATARDISGATGSASVTFTVANSVPGPAIAIVSPAAGATVSGNVTLQANATSSSGVASVWFAVDGTPVTSPWNSSGVANGPHTLTATAKDIAGLTASVNINLNVQNMAPGPIVSIASPTAGSTVSGTVTLQANASAANGIASLQFALDGTPVTSPWDSSKVANGNHSLVATAKDNAGVSASASINFTVRNSTAAPVISIVSPVAGSTVSGTVPLQANATSPAGIAGVQFSIDGTLVSTPWDSTKVGNGSHALTATATDLFGTSSSTTATFTVANISAAPDFTPPQVTITAPRNNGDAFGTTTLSANATDNIGVTSVSFYIDNLLIGDATSAPYQLSLDLRTMNGGVHYMTAVARDAAGNTAKNSISFSNVERSAPACGATGIGTFVGCYYSTLNLAQLATTRLDAGLNFDWAWTSPDPAVPATAYSIAWTGKFGFDTGNYGFELKSVGGARVYIDGRVVLDNWAGQQYADLFFPQAMTQGAHVVRVEYHRGTDAGAAKLFWWRN